MTLALPGPVRLLASLEAVQQAHPYSEHAPLVGGARLDADAAALWKRLLDAPASELARVIARLSKLEFRLLVASAKVRGADRQAQVVMAHAYRFSRDGSLATILWECFLLAADGTDLRDVAREIVGAPGSPALWKHLVEAKQPSLLAASAYLEQRATFEQWMASSAVKLADLPRFHRLVQRRLLEPPLLQRLDRGMDHATIDAWASTAIEAPERLAWQRTYLEATYGHPRALDHTVLERIVDQHGLPEGGREFWETVSERAIAGFNAWLNDRQLTQLLGEGDRVQFWRRYLPQMKGSYASHDGNVVFILFEKWFAAQFVRPGTATYLFPIKYKLSLRRDDEHSIQQRVRRNQEHKLGRYTHQGYYWEVRAETEVRMAMLKARNL